MSAIAVIGGGIGGLTVARALAGRHDVVVFEKGRGVGGRMATRRQADFRFDHGAQCFTVRTDRFADFIAPFVATSVVAEWTGRVVNIAGGAVVSTRGWHERHFVGAPDMNSLPKALAEGLTVRTGIDVAPLPTARQGGAWALESVGGEALGAFDLVISTTTPHQTLALLGPHGPVDSPINSGAMKPAYALMVGLGGPWAHDWIGAKVPDGPIKWISVNSSKPGRDAARAALVVHSRSGWAEGQLDADPAETQAALEEALSAAIGIDAAKADLVVLHRWRSALVKRTQKAGPWVDASNGLAATGDWSATSRIEEVVLSALDLAERL